MSIRRLAPFQLLIVLVIAGCAQSGDMRPEQDLPAGYGVECSGDHDVPPRLLAGKAPVFPASMLNPTYVDERRIKRLPLSWDVVTRFTVTASGTTTQVRSDATDPPYLAMHSNAAISTWQFEPARRVGEAVAAQCEHRLEFKLER